MYGVLSSVSAALVFLLARKVLHLRACACKAIYSVLLFPCLYCMPLLKASLQDQLYSTYGLEFLVPVSPTNQLFAISWLATIMPTGIYPLVAVISLSQVPRSISISVTLMMNLVLSL